MNSREQLLPKYDRMIKKAAWATARRYDLDFDDLLQEGYLIFLGAVDRYEPTQASFSTYLHNSLRALSALRQPFVRRERQYRFHTVSSPALDTLVEDTTIRLLDELAILESVEDLPPDALGVLEWLLDREAGFTIHKAALRRAITHFGSTYHWACERTTTAWDTLSAWWSRAAVA